MPFEACHGARRYSGGGRRSPGVDQLVRGARGSGGGSGGGDCVEVAGLAHGVAVRDSKDPRGGALRFGRGVWGRFVAGLRTLPPQP
ncbi:DUF397 domain-containing protein [Streptomyces sp. NPDC046939]|uniref:DUF397 domain-containing protein n=1 Tax=Streptomyces sp. NPDC046939 TaxID=3155376 RepID=UPI0033DAC6C8